MEIHKEAEGLKKLPKEENIVDGTERFMLEWRNSDFYDFVMKVLDDELNADLLKDAMKRAYIDGKPMTDDEIASMARTEAMSNLRIENIKEILK